MNNPHYNDNEKRLIESFRYPGSRPFENTRHDQKMFFGRDHDSSVLLHLLLSEQLVVLFARSGTGKSSLINAGLLPKLHEYSIIPFKVRLSDPTVDPVKLLLKSVEDEARKSGYDVVPGTGECFYDYFKTLECWTQDDKLLTPLIILDQFEEFFRYNNSYRNIFIRNLAEVLDPERSRKNIEDRDTMGEMVLPSVKALISIREDFLGELEELTSVIPQILENRCRLLPLRPDQAVDAIVKPGLLSDENIATPILHYKQEAIDTIIHFLSQCSEGNDIKLFVEPFQLQLICSNLEQKILAEKLSKDTVVEIGKDRLGGPREMQAVLSSFYETTVNEASKFYLHKLNLFSNLRIKFNTFFIKWRIQRFIESGLISSDNRRISLEKGFVKTKYHISEQILNDLVNMRLIRSESRLDSSYYELAHDSLIRPVKTYQKRRARKWLIVKTVSFTFVTFLLLYSIFKFIDRWNTDTNLYRIRVSLEKERYWEIEHLIKMFEKDSNNLHDERILTEIGKYYSFRGHNENASRLLQNALKLNDSSDANYYMGVTDYYLGQNDSALIYLQKATSKQNTSYNAFYYKIIINYELTRYDSALYELKNAVRNNPKNAYIIVEFLQEHVTKNTIRDAAFVVDLINYIQELEDTLPADYYNRLGRLIFDNNYWLLLDDSLCNFFYDKAINCDSLFPMPYFNKAFLFMSEKKFDSAVVWCRKLVRTGGKDIKLLYNCTFCGLMANENKYVDTLIDSAFKRSNYHPDISFSPLFRFANIYNLLATQTYENIADEIGSFKIDYKRSDSEKIRIQNWNNFPFMDTTINIDLLPKDGFSTEDNKCVSLLKKLLKKEKYQDKKCDIDSLDVFIKYYHERYNH
jgi:tetratricopeptide (TPR) repeat protein